MGLNDWPDPSCERELHKRTLECDALAWPDVCVAFLDVLIRYMLEHNPSVDPMHVEDAVHIAIMNYLKRPSTFDPTRGSLGTYLKMSSQGDLKNILQREHRHWRGREEFLVANEPAIGNQEDEDEPDWNDPRLQACLAELNEADRAAIELIRKGERSTAKFAPLWGCADAPVDERAEEVKRNKDRLLKHLKRRLNSHE